MNTQPIYKSRRFWSAAVGVVMMIVVHYLPELASSASVLTSAILVVTGFLVGGYTIEDSIQAASKR